MRVYEGEGIGSMYFQLIRDVTERGRKIIVRGQECLELPEPVTLVYEKPGFCWMRIPGRKFNPFFALAEVMWILSGNGNVEWISYFNSNMRSFADDGQKDFHGSYGMRMRQWPAHWAGYVHLDQIEWVVKKLNKDMYSRQAVICLWDPDRDNYIPTKDIPCNNIVYFSLREGFLDQTVVIRSNDLIWGTPINAIQFTHLQALVAGMLGVSMGKLTYVIQNLHYYLNLYKPTLSNVIEQAYEKRIQAESIPSFDTVTDVEFEIASKRVEEIVASYTEKNHDLVKGFGVGYWGFVIPRMVYLYCFIKSNPKPDGYASEKAVELIASFGQPLTDLIVDFYKDSKNEMAQKILQSLQTRAEITWQPEKKQKDTLETGTRE